MNIQGIILLFSQINIFVKEKLKDEALGTLISSVFPSGPSVKFQQLGRGKLSLYIR